MMTSSNIQAKPMNTDENQSLVAAPGSRKTGSSLKQQQQQQQQPPEQALKCPRCDSSNTKFCYYNNYSLTQPRHFCKTCRRYWTRGGALRNVPIGGGCRKNAKKTKSSSSSRLSADYSKEYSSPSSSSENYGGLKFFQHGISSPSMEFQLGGGAAGGLSLSRLHPSTTSHGVYNNHQYASFGDHSSTNYNPSLMGFNFPVGSSSVLTNGGGNMIQAAGEMGSSAPLNGHHTNLASSIESLSCINQDLHWKLQQQRLGMLFGTGGGENNNNQKESNHLDLHETAEKPQPILFQNLEISKPEAASSAVCSIPRKTSGGNVGGNPNSTEWFFENNNNSNQENDSRSSWDGIQAAWGTTGLNHQFAGLPE